jgi:ABC-2 type transport system ATP-binding protein
MIEIHNLTMKYKNGKGVGDISISVDNGEVKGLLGPNGAGKSTTMRSLMGFLIPSQGTLSVEGINTIENPVEAKKNNRIFTRRSSTSTKLKF